MLRAAEPIARLAKATSVLAEASARRADASCRAACIDRMLDDAEQARRTVTPPLRDVAD